MRYKKTTNPTEFWTSVSPFTCWEWEGGRDRDGYGQTRVGKTRVKAHRHAWEIMNGQIPAGLLVLHRCNNPSCVRPDHLYLGTALDNGIDRRSRGRKRVTTALSPADVADIRSRYATATIRQRELASEYGVSQGTISRIVLGKTYRFDKSVRSNIRRSE